MNHFFTENDLNSLLNVHINFKLIPIHVYLRFSSIFTFKNVNSTKFQRKNSYTSAKKKNINSILHQKTLDINKFSELSHNYLTHNTHLMTDQKKQQLSYGNQSPI